jgi:hypothetical protein
MCLVAAEESFFFKKNDAIRYTEAKKKGKNEALLQSSVQKDCILDTFLFKLDMKPRGANDAEAAC